MNQSHYTPQDLALASWTWVQPQGDTPPSSHHAPQAKAMSFDLLHPLRRWIDTLEIHDPSVARLICEKIPSQCPFERDITLWGHRVLHIPPLCKLNPLYEQVVGLRFRALCYLADECGEDVTSYC